MLLFAGSMWWDNSQSIPLWASIRAIRRGEPGNAFALQLHCEDLTVRGVGVTLVAYIYFVIGFRSV